MFYVTLENNGLVIPWIVSLSVNTVPNTVS